MYNLFRNTFRTLLVALLAFMAFTFMTFHASAKQHYRRAYHAPTVTPSPVFILSFDANDNLVLNHSFDAPTPVKLPAAIIANILYPKDATKPDNLNYQPIRWRSLGLVDAQMNI